MFRVCHQKRHETGKYFPISQTTFYWWLSNALKIRFLLIWWAHEDKWAVETSRIDSTARTIERPASKKDYTYWNQSQTHETTAECEEGDIVSTEVAIDGSIYGAESKMKRNNNTHTWNSRRLCFTSKKRSMMMITIRHCWMHVFSALQAPTQ